MENKLYSIAQQFQVDGKIEQVQPLGEGFINDTFIIKTEQGSPDYILQRKNKNIFTDVPAMMNNIEMVTTHLKKKIVARGGNPMREAMTVTRTHDGKLYFQDEDGEFWAACIFIGDTIAYQAATTPELAFQGGKGIGQFQAMLADFTEPLADILPGFHNMRYRFKQWDAILAKDPVSRKAECAEQIQWIESRRDEMMELWEKFEQGIIPTRVTHNDTKINNVLFDKQGNVLCVIDLDTVLSSTILNDYGDAMRFYTNTGTEDDLNLDNVTSDLEIFRGFTAGYLSQAAPFLNQAEVDYLAFSAKYITFEQVLRFLMDYIDGDNYYKTKSPEHNMVRTKAQYKLLTDMESKYPQMCAIVKEEYQKYAK